MPARSLVFVIGLALGVALSAGIGLGLALAPETAAPRAPSALPLPAAEAPLALPEERTIAVFRAAREGVVAITTSAQVRDPFSRRVGERPLGSGSGFLWNADGYVVTNNHVIAGASRAVVQLADGRSLDAQVVGTAPGHDLAVLRIAAGDLPAPLPLAEAGGLEVGQSVLAIGNPFGLDWTLTSGIVSALDRDLQEEGGRTIRGVIQTDAAINPGNSGGPLLDASGRLVGVTTAIYSPSGANAGIGFAVPVGAVLRVVPQLIETGRYSPPSLGLGFDSQINAAVNRQGLEGALVLEVMPDSDAARAGITHAQLSRDGRIIPGDVIKTLDGLPVDTLDALLAALDRRRVGDEVTLGLEKDGARREVVLQLQ
ncbi:S1C family serine protease [Pseudoroseicyclus aestuarii]|uniref:DegP2 peptidase n=1 Tax=Pseudoroseicyclus aestuarii TaxID=1795041 RepID=A0A318SPJ4_9RHOB|nr:trypsin-like peptidase domain-containing protein [Pseudoroseicyclus aestuarii]PYE82258.1 DegP2 peptidase [Pseudoroseicyclus aestuarii]